MKTPSRKGRSFLRFIGNPVKQGCDPKTGIVMIEMIYSPAFKRIKNVRSNKYFQYHNY
jgi:hypothetical protein